METIQTLVETVESMIQTAKSETRALNPVELGLLHDYLPRAAALADQQGQYTGWHQRIDAIQESLHRPVMPPIRSDLGRYSRRDFRSKGNGEFFSSLGEQLQAIFRASQPGQKPDDRLFKIVEKEERATGLSESIGGSGGFLLEQSFTGDLLREVFETAQLARYCRSIPITLGNSVKIPAFDEKSRANGSRLGGIRAFWLNEGGTKVASQPHFRNMELNLKKLIGLCYTTDELLSDATLLGNVISSGFRSEFGFMIDQGIISGSGAGQILGIMNSGALITVTRNTASSILFEDLCSIWSRLLPGSGKRSIWIINQDCIPQLMQLTIGTSDYPAYLPANGAAGQPYDTLLGRPCVQCEQAKSLGTSGDIILADLQEGFVLGQKGGIEFASSIHTSFVTDETAFRSNGPLAGAILHDNSLQIRGNLNYATV